MAEDSALESNFQESTVESCVEIRGFDVDNLN